MTRAIAYPLVAALLLAGCASTGNIRPQVAEVAPTSLGLDAGAAPVDAQWWHAFGDPQLDALVAAGLAGNPSLDAALARVHAAEAGIAVDRAGLRPQINGSAQIDRARIGDALVPAPIGGGDAAIAISDASLKWDLDPFGRKRAMVRQASAAADAARLDLAEARLTLSVSIARTYIGFARAQKLIEVADGFVATRRQALGFVNARIGNQLSSQFDLRQAQTLLAEAEQAETQAVHQRDVLIHALAALAGRGADFYPRITKPTLALDRAPAVPEMLPADLLGRRPDLLAGQSRIDVAVQGRKVAAAAFLPDVSISALAALASTGLSGFFTGGAFSYSAGPAVSLPIFEGGRLRAQYRGATADLDEAVANYNDAVIGAVREAADAVTDVRSADRELADQGRVVQGLRDTVRLDQVRIQTGLGSQLDSIDSGFRLLQAEQDLVGLQADALTRRVQLVAALGGGFDTTRSQVATAKADTRS